MTTEQIIAMQRRVGTTPDGIWGPKSAAACQRHLRALMPSPHPWPRGDQASLRAFYGSPGDESQLVSIDVAGLGVMYDNRPVHTIRCHRKVAASLRRVLEKLPRGITAKYAGVYNNRPVRGGSTPSLHAYGAAIDLDPDNNGNMTPWPSKSLMPLDVMETFAREGWLPAGAFWGRDAMHFQATQ